MTPCEERGWKVGDLFQATNGSKRVGNIVQLVDDDGSNCPFFITLFGAPLTRAKTLPHNITFDSIYWVTDITPINQTKETDND